VKTIRLYRTYRRLTLKNTWRNLTLAKGHARLWITDSKVTHSHDSVVAGNGAIEWIKFAVEITLPDDR
jgi:hypothetical protein